MGPSEFKCRPPLYLILSGMDGPPGGVVRTRDAAKLFVLYTYFRKSKKKILVLTKIQYNKNERNLSFREKRTISLMLLRNYFVPPLVRTRANLGPFYGS